MDRRNGVIREKALVAVRALNHIPALRLLDTGYVLPFLRSILLCLGRVCVILVSIGLFVPRYPYRSRLAYHSASWPTRQRSPLPKLFQTTWTSLFSYSTLHYPSLRYLRCEHYLSWFQSSESKSTQLQNHFFSRRYFSGTFPTQCKMCIICWVRKVRSCCH